MKATAQFVFSALGIATGTMSVVSLVAYGVNVGTWTAPASLIISQWDALLSVLFTKFVPIGPCLEVILGMLANVFRWQAVPELHSHWKHIFVLLMTIFGAFTTRTLLEGNYLFGSYGFCVGLLFALIASLSVGVIDLDSSGFFENYAVAAVPAVLFWLTIFVVWFPRGGITGHDLSDMVLRSIVALVGIAIGVMVLLRIPVIRDSSQAGLICFAGFVIAVALNRIYFGFKASRTANSSFYTHPLTKRGLVILGAFVGAGIFIIANAGLKLLGL